MCFVDNEHDRWFERKVHAGCWEIKLQVEVGTLGEMAEILSLSNLLGVSACENIGMDDLIVQQGVDFKLVQETFTWHPPCARHCNWC